MPKLPKLIAIYSPAPQSGKSTIANYLVDKYGYTKVPFASILKEMARPIFTSLGYTFQDIYGFETTQKEVMLPVIGTTPRRIYQTLGTEWGRNMINADLWIKLWEARAKQHELVVVDDMRFPNEMEKVKEMGGICLKIVRNGVDGFSMEHSSEGGLNSERFDCEILNQPNTSLQDLFNLTDDAISGDISVKNM